MKYFVKWEVRETLSEKDIARLKEEFASRLAFVENSGKMKDGGVLMGIRGGYFILDIEKPAELLRLLGPTLWDNCVIDAYPIITFKDLAEYFEKEEFKKAA